MIDSHTSFPASPAFAGAMGMRIGGGLPQGLRPGTPHRFAAPSCGWVLRPNGRGISQ